MKRRVLWVPVYNDGGNWVGYYGGFQRGYVMRVSRGQYVVRVQGRRARKYAPTMREAAKHLVAFVNNTSPCLIP